MAWLVMLTAAPTTPVDPLNGDVAHVGFHDRRQALVAVAAVRRGEHLNRQGGGLLADHPPHVFHHRVVKTRVDLIDEQHSTAGIRKGQRQSEHPPRTVSHAAYRDLARYSAKLEYYSTGRIAIQKAPLVCNGSNVLDGRFDDTKRPFDCLILFRKFELAIRTNDICSRHAAGSDELSGLARTVPHAHRSPKSQQEPVIGNESPVIVLWVRPLEVQGEPLVLVAHRIVRFIELRIRQILHVHRHLVVPIGGSSGVAVTVRLDAYCTAQLVVQEQVRNVERFRPRADGRAGIPLIRCSPTLPAGR